MQIFSFFCLRAMHFSSSIANFTDYSEQARTASDKKIPREPDKRLAREMFDMRKNRNDQANGWTVTSLLIFEISP